jgi:hypothetical protein
MFSDAELDACLPGMSQFLLLTRCIPTLTSSDALGGSSSQPGGILCELTSDAFELCSQKTALRRRRYFLVR